MLEDQIRKVLVQASKDKNTLAKNVLSLALGEIQTVEARGKVLTEKDKENIVAKLVKSNTQTLQQLQDGDQRKEDLKLENEILKQFLPNTLSKEETMELLMSLNAELNSCDVVGKAIGVVMKYTKANNIPVDNKIVKECVEEFLAPIPLMGVVDKDGNYIPYSVHGCPGTVVKVD